MNESMKPILARLIAARKAAGLTQQEAAEAIGLTRASSLSDLETGRNEMKVSQLLALCELYGVSPARIMGSMLKENMAERLKPEYLQALRERQAGLESLESAGIARPQHYVIAGKDARILLDHIDALEARESALIDTLAEIEALLTVHDTPIADTLVERIRILIQEAGYSA